jgi:hypothetical protein
MDSNNKRTTKEYKLNNNVKIKTKYGTLDKNNPEILYIRSRATITPEIKKKDFSEDIALIKRIFEKNVKTIIFESNVFENKHICNIEMSENGIAFGKKSHVKYDIYIKPKISKKLEEYKNDVIDLVCLFNQNLSQSLTENNIKIE